MKILVCGDRNWQYDIAINMALSFIKPKPKQIIEGGATGADQMAAEWAKINNVEINEYQAEWTKFGRAAGPIRNARMLQEKPDIVISFHNHIEQSKGTKNMIYQALKANIEVWLIRWNFKDVVLTEIHNKNDLKTLELI